MNRFTLTATANIFLIQNNSICLIRRYNTGWHDGDYEVPAGHIDGNEEVIDAACREAKEEVGVTVLPEDIEVVHVMHRKGNKDEKIEFFCMAKKWEGEPEIKEVDKADDVRWFPIDGLPPNIIPKTKQAIEMFLAKKPYSGFGW